MVNGDVPRCLANGGELGRRRAFRGLTRSAPSSRARFENFRGRKCSAFARRKPTAFTSAELVIGKASRRPYWLPPRRAPFGRRAGQPSEGAPTRSACPGLLAS